MLSSHEKAFAFRNKIKHFSQYTLYRVAAKAKIPDTNLQLSLILMTNKSKTSVDLQGSFADGCGYAHAAPRITVLVETESVGFTCRIEMGRPSGVGSKPTCAGAAC